MGFCGEYIDMKRHRRQSVVFPKEGQYGIQVPLGDWHSVVVHGASVTSEAKDGSMKRICGNVSLEK